MLFKKLLNIFNTIVTNEQRIKRVTSPFGGTWTHLFVIRENNTVYVYLNNTLIGSKVLTDKHLELDSNNQIGQSIFNPSSILQGELKRFLFYNYAVDSTERTNIYNDV